jgi:hypothetical protein
VQIDFTPLQEDITRIDDFSRRFSVDDLKSATNIQLDTILEIIDGLEDQHLVFEPDDPEADDPFAREGEQFIGWSLAHLVLHVTASSEEGAAFGSLLARGIPTGAHGYRPRYEPDWRDVETREQVLQRIGESRRMRLAYLDTWPDQPHLDVCRIFPEGSPLHNKLNAVGSVLFGLKHEVGHFAQMRKVRRQALDAFPLE